MLESYPGDSREHFDTPEGGFKVPFEFPDPFLLLCYFEPEINKGIVTLHKWQRAVHKELFDKKYTSKHACKYCLIAANGSGKDKYIIAPFAVFFCLCKIRSRTIITTASGTQLTSQTEPYIVDLCNKINAYTTLHLGGEVFKIRQRFIYCTLTGSEVRMFATDEKGKAEGYHPIDPNSEMAIIVNEGKSVSEDIHEALRRCTGYNYWLEVSSAGEPSGFFYKAATLWPSTKRVTSYDCPHLSEEDIASDKLELGEHSAFFRSKHLSLFTTVNAETVISEDAINHALKYPPLFRIEDFGTRIGIDLAAGGDENVITIVKGNKVFKEICFRELDTTLTVDRIEKYLEENSIDKGHKYIFADDGGLGRSIIDMLSRKGWNINRVMNQWAAVGNRKQYGNRGAENWYRLKRIIEERFIDITLCSERTISQLKTRHYKQSTNGGRIFLRSKKEEKAEGYPSPDRADALVLSFSGLSVEDFIQKAPTNYKALNPPKERPRETFKSSQKVYEHYENTVTFAGFDQRQKFEAKKLKMRDRSLRHLINI